MVGDRAGGELVDLQPGGVVANHASHAAVDVAADKEDLIILDAFYN